MPLHLLGKKSWNVYNEDNVARVRRDEAEAKAREEAEEQRQQEVDSARRIALLRGEEPPPLSAESAEANAGGFEADNERARRAHDHGFPRKRRRLRNEDDTDRDIRFAREDAEAGEKAKESLKRGEKHDAPLLDHDGHLQLIPAPDEKDIRKTEKNAEAEAEKAKKRKREEDQYTMRFNNAAGFNNSMASPWYANSGTKASSESLHPSTDKALALPHLQEKDVWGNGDPLRKERERNRISSSDPFAAMQQAQKQLKQSEKDKEKWRQERLGEIEELKKDEERKRRREKEKRRSRREEDEHDLEGFRLDAVPSEKEKRRDGHGHHHRRHRHRSRSRSRSRSRDRGRRRH